MPIRNIGEDAFTQEAITQWQQVGQRFFEDVPSFKGVWNDVVESRGPRHSEDHPLVQLANYVQSLMDTCQQALYSTERLNVFCNQESSNTFAFYARHYAYDFLARVTTATDLLALMINHVFELGLPDKACRLDKGDVSAELRKIDLSDQYEELAKTLDRGTNWVSPYYGFRNVVIHQARIGGGDVLVGDIGTCPSRIHIWPPIRSGSSISIDPMRPFASLKPLADQGEPFSKFLWQIRSKSVSQYLSVDPVILCKEIWKLLSALLEEVIDESEPQIAKFISAKKLL